MKLLVKHVMVAAVSFALVFAFMHYAEAEDSTEHTTGAISGNLTPLDQIDASKLETIDLKPLTFDEFREKYGVSPDEYMMNGQTTPSPAAEQHEPAPNSPHE